jgi:hypothetical protein
MSAYGEYDHDEYDDYDRPISGRQVAVIDLLDRLLSGGVVLTGDVVLSVADIDLVRISLRAVIVAVREQLDDQWALALPTRAHPETYPKAYPKAYPEAYPETSPDTYPKAYPEGVGHGDAPG